MEKIIKASMCYENRQKYMKIVRGLKKQLPYGSIAKVAAKYTDIPLKHIYLALQGRRVDFEIISIFQAGLEEYLSEQKTISDQLNRLTANSTISNQAAIYSNTSSANF